MALFGNRYGSFLTQDYWLGNGQTNDQIAIWRQPPQKGLIYHSDCGTQYCSKAYHSLLEEYGIISSMSRKGNCYDNACIELFHSVIRKEWIFHENTVLESKLRQVF